MNTTYTNTQLKQTLAKMLSPSLIVWYRNPQFPAQAALRYCDNGESVLDTELLHLYWLAEETLDFGQQLSLAELLYNTLYAQTDGLPTCAKGTYLSVHASWQQRVIALAKVKGVEIV